MADRLGEKHNLARLVKQGFTKQQEYYIWGHELPVQYLASKPTIESLHFENLKISEPDIRVSLSRMTIEDGAPYNNQVIIEVPIDGEWLVVKTYEAK